MIRNIWSGADLRYTGPHSNSKNQANREIFTIENLREFIYSTLKGCKRAQKRETTRNVQGFSFMQVPSDAWYKTTNEWAAPGIMFGDSRKALPDMTPQTAMAHLICSVGVGASASPVVYSQQNKNFAQIQPKVALNSTWLHRSHANKLRP